MVEAFLRISDWQRDLPDHRDCTPQSHRVRKLLRTTKSSSEPHHLPVQVDWREYFPPVQDQQNLPTSTALANLAMVQYFERRATGRLLEPSRIFVHQNAQRLANRQGMDAASSRDTLKAIVRFGLPPEIYWPHDAAQLAKEPPPFLYGFARDYHTICYCRLDGRELAGSAVLDNIKSFLSAGLLCVLGFPLGNSLTNDAEIPFPTLHDTAQAGHCVAIVGYDDRTRIRSDKGALLLRNSWGRNWGDNGYGWLPYSYVREKLAVDVWTLLKKEWLASGEFELPR